MKKLIAVLLMMTLGLPVVHAKEGVTLTGVINVNTATAEELMLLPGVGQARAQTIIQTRAVKPFASKEDLLAVKGIGEKMIADWASLIVFSGTTTLKEVPVAAAPAPAPAK